MKYKGILLDIDNTIYNYDTCHQKAMDTVLEYANGLKIQNFKEAFLQGRKIVHIELSQSASSHNRLLYFQKTCEILNLNPLEYGLKFYDLYWDTFLDNIILYDGVIEFLKKSQDKLEICFVTDLTAHIQYRKITKLNLSQYVTNIVTSEEAGREKPHPYMFLLALQKLGLKPSEVCMIGDSFSKDVLGATALGIDTIWLEDEQNNDFKENKQIKKVATFKDILELLWMR